MARAVNTKSDILNVALKLFSERTYHGTSIRDIAKEIQKRESSIYNHFNSKEEILKEIVENFSKRNFGKIILTDKLVNTISKPEKFFLILAENILEFWDSQNERMFIKILVDSRSVKTLNLDYNINTYLSDFRSMIEFILGEMMKHKFIGKFDLKILSTEFISPLFLYHFESLLGYQDEVKNRKLLSSHIEFFWKAIKK